MTPARALGSVLLCLFVLHPLAGQEATPIEPVLGTATGAARSDGVDWTSLLAQSSRLLVVQHGFRILTEPGTRRELSGPFFRRYTESVANMHGWADGDPFYVNYVGHPMQGAVTGFLFAQNDRRYRTIEFGANRDYWRSRLRSAAFSLLYSVQFEIGPFSEASVGHIQSQYPQQGFVDHVVTPVVGLGWMVTEDWLDRVIIRRFEGRFRNPYARLLVRGALNPSRSFANAMALRVPWYRDSRSGVWTYTAPVAEKKHESRPAPADPPGPAPFEFELGPRSTYYTSSGDWCGGGGASAAVRLSPSLQWVSDISGCKLVSWRKGWSGDTLSYLTGPRWTAETGRRWIPRAQMLAGGLKVTHEFEPATPRQTSAVNGFQLAAGGGLDLKLNRAFQLTVADLEYRRSWMPPLDGRDYKSGVNFRTGLVVRMGTW